MIRINLLPKDDRQPEWPLKRIYAIISGALLVVLILAFAGTTIQFWHKERQIVEARNQYELLRPTEVIMQDTSLKQQTVNAKNNILTNLTNERKSWAPIIGHLATLTTPRIWFTELSTINKDAIKVIGIADNYQEISTFLQRLEQDTIFAEPVLVQAELDPKNAKAITKFEIIVKLRGMK